MSHLKYADIYTKYILYVISTFIHVLNSIIGIVNIIVRVPVC